MLARAAYSQKTYVGKPPMPTHDREAQSTRNDHGSPIGASDQKGTPIAIHPFYEDPRELLFLNVYLGHQMKLVDREPVKGNFLASLSLAALSTQVSENGLYYYFLLQGGCWLLWLVGGTDIKRVLTATELWDGLSFPTYDKENPYNVNKA
jgi:hypothetical protein